MACGAVAAVAADAERGAGVALLPAADEGGLADEGAREADVLDLCGVQHVVDELQAAQAAHEGHGDVHLVGQPRGGMEEGAFVHAGADALPRGAIGTDLYGIDAGYAGVSPAIAGYAGVPPVIAGYAGVSPATNQFARRDEILLGHPAGVFVGGVDLDGDEEVGGGLAPHIGKDDGEDMGAAVAVGAVVEQRRDEAAEVEEVGGVALRKSLSDTPYHPLAY